MALNCADPKAVLAQAGCLLGCLTPMQRRRVRAYLLCQIVLTGRPFVVVAQGGQAQGQLVALSIPDNEL